MNVNEISTQTPPASQQGEPNASTVEQPKESLTAEDIRRIAREEALRTSQSLMDKAQSRIQKQLDALKGANVQVTDDQVQRLRDSITKEVMDEERGGPADLPPNMQPANGQSPISPVVAEALELMNEEKVQIEDGDPELAGMLKVIQDTKATRAQRTKAVFSAIEAKRTRLNQNADTAHLRTPSGTGDAAPVTAKSASDYWEKAYKK